MSVAAPERETPPRRPRGGLALIGVGLLALALAVIAVSLIGFLPGLVNPFHERRVDRSPPALLRSLSQMHQYRAATGHFETIVDLEHDTAPIPTFIKGDRTLFVAVGNVDAGVDFSHLDARSLAVSPDRRAVTVTLPPARVLEPHVDPAHSHVVDRQRGLIDRIGSVFESNPSNDRELYLLSERKLAAAARDPGSGLVTSAEQNTRSMLEGLMRGLGFERVDVRFG